MCVGSVQIPPRRPYSSRPQRSEPVTNLQAKEAALRLIHSHFGLQDHARISIPAQLTDDDILLMDYLEQALQGEMGLEPGVQLLGILVGTLEGALAGSSVRIKVREFKCDAVTGKCTVEGHLVDRLR